MRSFAPLLPVLGLLVSSTVAAGFVSAAPQADASRPASVAGAFASLDDLDAALEKIAAGADPADFWQRVEASGPLPLVFGETAVFLYRGQAESVEWRGGFSGWDAEHAARGRRLGDSDVWEMRRSFPPAARIDYKIVVDGQHWLLDPGNPHQQVGGFGPNSEVRMPGWEAPDHVRRRESEARGTFTEDRWLDSRVLGYGVRYRVWSPPGWDGARGSDPATPAAARLPVLYVTDGSDYWRDEMGALVVTLDNLYAAGEIAPLLAVFVDPWDRERRENRRVAEYLPGEDGSCRFCAFFASELVPAVDAAWATRATTEGRALLGTSFGGLVTALVGLHHPELVSRLGIQSPAFDPAPGLVERVGTAERFPAQVFVSAGQYEADILETARRLAAALRARPVGPDAPATEVLLVEVPEDHSWGAWRAQLDDLLRFFYPPNSHPPSAAAAPVAREVEP